MELDILKNFVNRDVELLVGGVWLEGHMTPIVKGVITLLPFQNAAEFYGPAALKADVVQAVRLVKKQVAAASQVPNLNTPTSAPIKSGFEQAPVGAKFVVR
jgi:hypothetical protein